MARFGFSLAQLIENVIGDEEALVNGALAGVCLVLIGQVLFAGKSFSTMRKHQPDWWRLKYHYRVKAAIVGLQAAAYSVYVYAKQNSDGNTARTGGFIVCVFLLIAVELYLSYGLYSGYHMGERGIVADGDEESRAPPGKEVVGIPFIARKKRIREPVEFEIPIYDYTGRKD